MKQCPKCNASIIDTAKFCPKCGVNIKKYEEEHAKNRFCPECGTPVADGDFCIECGYRVNGASEKTKSTSAEQTAWNIGDTVTLGMYCQNSLSRKDPIEWIVLKREGSKALLISKYLLSCKMYNREYVDTTWETSSIRKWLNNEFLKEAFSEIEQKNIQYTKIITQDNLVRKTKGGNMTVDKLFILSTEEANLYFSSDDERKCVPTLYAEVTESYKKIGADGWTWWLRSPGDEQGCATVVSGTGHISDYGFFVNIISNGVRPALWIDLS